MSESQVIALWAMFMIGIFGVAFATENSKKLRFFGAVWVAAWWLPPLVMLWIKGVFG